MYGLINNALKNMIVDHFGENRWQEVLQTSGIPEDSFLTMRNYDDAITYSLAGAASEVLGAPLDDCLEMFGEYWVANTAPESYEMLMDAAGQNMAEFLGNLNALHDRITTTFLHYAPPNFQVEHQEANRYLIHYKSHRQGLTPFVVGLLRGLALRFNSELTIHSQREETTQEGSHTIFEVEITPP